MRFELRLDQRLIDRITEQGKREALTDSAEHLLGAANKSVPYQEGNLEGSGFTDYDGEHASVAYDTPYARRLHEHPEYNFNFNRRGKWLELAMQEEKNTIRGIMQDRLKNAFRR